MLKPQSSYSIDGKLGAIELNIIITVCTEDADAHKGLNASRPNKPMTADPHNIQAMLVMAINEVLSILQADEEGYQEPARVNVPSSGSSNGKVLDMQAYRRALEEANKGEGN